MIQNWTNFKTGQTWPSEPLSLVNVPPTTIFSPISCWKFSTLDVYGQTELVLGKISELEKFQDWTNFKTGQISKLDKLVKSSQVFACWLCNLSLGLGSNFCLHMSYATQVLSV